MKLARARISSQYSLALLPLTLSLFLIVATLEPFAFGYWRNAEPLVVALHAVSALCALILAMIALREPGRFWAGVQHPYVAIPFALGIWGLLTAPTADYPILSILGAPQSGLGALWWLDLSALVALGRLIFANARTLALVRVATICGAILLAGILLTVRLTGGDWTLPVPDFAAYAAFALPVILLAGRPMDRNAAPVVLAVLVLVVVLLTVAGNIAATAIALVVATIVVTNRMSGRPTKRVGPIWVSAIVLAAIALPPLLLVSLPPLQQVASLESRLLLWRVIAAAIAAEPATLIWGAGWGHTQEAFVLHLNAVGQALVNPTWDLLWRDFFHSHNALTEALYSAGLPGMLLALSFYLMIPLAASADRRQEALLFALALSALDALWFQLAYTLPFVAVALAVLAPLSKDDAPAIVVSGSRWWPLAFIPLLHMAAAGVAAMAIWVAGHRVDDFRSALVCPTLQEALTPADFDPYGHDVALSLVVRGYVGRLPTQDENEVAGASCHRHHLAEIQSDLDRVIVQDGPAMPAMAGLALYSAVYLSPDHTWARLALPDTETWGRWAQVWLATAPARTDAVIPYLTYLSQQARRDEARAFTASILVRQPDDPVGLFFSGAMLLGNPAQRDEGIRRIRRSLDNGIERYMPVDAGIKYVIRHGGQ